MTPTTEHAITEFVNHWNDNGNRCKDGFLRLKEHCMHLPGIRLEWHARPGITYSLRAAHADQTERDLFAMVDIIDDDPQARWLSVCFYDDLVNDPDEVGDQVPEGLLGEDAICFDVDEWDEQRLAYVEARLSEACAAAARGIQA
jgi:hypothetical protein